MALATHLDCPFDLQQQLVPDWACYECTALQLRGQGAVLNLLTQQQMTIQVLPGVTTRLCSIG
jgi:hypothetical protein